MADSQKKRTVLLAVLAAALVVSFGGYQGWKVYSAQNASSKTKMVATARKLPVSKTPSESDAPSPPPIHSTESVEPLQEKLPAVDGSSKETPPGSNSSPNQDLAAVPAQPVSPPPTPATPARDPMGATVPNLVGRMPPEKTLREPDPRQTGGFQGEIFVRLDLNGDLRLEPMEIPTKYREQMLACDLDNNGQINFSEFQSSIDKLPEVSANRQTVAASALINPPAAGQEIPIYERKVDRKNKLAAPLWFTNYDRSGDGHIAVYEWPEGRLNEFRALDANNDGFITLEEARKAEQLKETMESVSPASSEPKPTTPRPSEPASRMTGR